MNTVLPEQTREVRIHKNHSDVTFSSNTTGQLSDVFTLKAPDQVGYLIESGFHLKMKLLDGSQNDLPADDEIILVKNRPGDIKDQSVASFLLEDWVRLDLSEQTKGENIPNLRVEMANADAVRIAPGEELIFQINSGTSINTSNSTLTFKAFTFPVQV